MADHLTIDHLTLYRSRYPGEDYWINPMDRARIKKWCGAAFVDGVLCSWKVPPGLVAKDPSNGGQYYNECPGAIAPGQTISAGKPSLTLYDIDAYVRQYGRGEVYISKVDCVCIFPKAYTPSIRCRGAKVTPSSCVHTGHIASDVVNGVAYYQPRGQASVEAPT